MAAKGKAEPIRQTDEEMADAEAQAMEIITADPATLRPAQRAVRDMLTALEAMATDDTESQKFTGEDIAAILLAETERDMWDADDLPRLNAKILSGCNLAVYGWEVKFSNSTDIVTGLLGPQSRRKMYLLIRSARLDDSGQNNLYRLPKVGEEFMWNTSARYIVAKLFWLRRHGSFDNGTGIHARIEGTELDGGKSVEKLKEIGFRAPRMPVMVPDNEPPF